MLIGNSDGNSSAHTLPPMVYFIIQCNRIEAEKQPLGVNTVGSRRLENQTPGKQGVNTDEAPAFLRDLFKILESNLGIDAATANSKLQLLGWNTDDCEITGSAC
jgi:hypothetical protein